MNLYIENIASTSQQIWISIYEVIHDDYFKVVKLFPTAFLDQCKKIKINLRIYQMKSNKLRKRWLWKMYCMNKFLFAAEKTIYDADA